MLQIVKILSGAMTTLSAVDPLNQLIMFVTSYLASWTDSTCGEQAPSSLARTTTSTLGRLWCLASSHRYELKGFYYNPLEVCVQYTNRMGDPSSSSVLSIQIYLESSQACVCMNCKCCLCYYNIYINDCVYVW